MMTKKLRKLSLEWAKGAAANRRHAGQADGSDNLSATVAADRAFPAAVAERSTNMPTAGMDWPRKGEKAQNAQKRSSCSGVGRLHQVALVRFLLRLLRFFAAIPTS